jgi:hypothetical protein
MPNPTVSAVHVDSLLTDVSVAFIQSSTKYIATRVFPSVPVQQKSDLYATYSQADFLRDEVQERMAGSPAVRIGYRTGTDSYTAIEWAAAHAIDDQVRANADSPFSPEMDAVKFLVQKMMIRRDVDFVTRYMGTGIWGTDSSGGSDFTQWSNAASTPIEDITDAGVTMEAASGFLPNKLVVSRQVWADLKNHPDIVDRIKHTSRDAVTTDLVARLFGLDEVLIAAAIRNTRGEGLTHSGAHIAGDDALLVYSPASPGLMQPCAGKTFEWSGLVPGAVGGQVVERYRDENNVSDIVRVRAAWAQKVVSTQLGVFFNNASTNS